mmetsp:Transcript_2565/g.3777  ORF Transcript_2565/g.3777 Transcript_2565/m.3777 type:complete len:128 (-) Transcript_2565:1952-2335(-)
MFSALPLCIFELENRRQYGWKMFHATVQNSTISFSEFDRLAEGRDYGYSSRDYDTSNDIDLAVPSPIPLQPGTDLSFACQNTKTGSKIVDAFVVKLLGRWVWMIQQKRKMLAGVGRFRVFWKTLAVC